MSNVSHHMSIPGNQRLFDLASANSQRLALRHVAESAPQALSAFVRSSEPIFHPHTPMPILEALSRANGIHAGSSPKGGFEIFETSSHEIAAAWLLSRVQRLLEGTYFVFFGGSDQITVSSRSQWVPRLPVFRSSKSALLAAFEAIRDVSRDHFAVVATSGKASLVLDHYVGVLPDAPSPNEIVYELSFSAGDG
jgi:hypothetical protein